MRECEAAHLRGKPPETRQTAPEVTRALDYLAFRLLLASDYATALARTYAYHDQTTVDVDTVESVLRRARVEAGPGAPLSLLRMIARDLDIRIGEPNQ